MHLCLLLMSSHFLYVVHGGATSSGLMSLLQILTSVRYWEAALSAVRTTLEASNAHVTLAINWILATMSRALR